MQPIQIPKQVLKDKILGGWTGKSYGAMMGEPMEFAAQGSIYEGTLDIHPKAPTIWLHNEDDLYVNMAFLEIMQEKGLDATQDDFATVFRESKFMLWHANGQARQNILAGVKPGLSGHPVHNPHADDIDFQIECDFIGLVCPGMPQTARVIADKVGHLMNYGDGYYAGVFLAALYTAAFYDANIPRMIRNSLQTIPDGSDYKEMIRDLLGWHEENPEDWRSTWQKLEDKWNFDRCPWAKTDQGRFNIQGSFNGAYIVLGLLYGQGDYIKAISICTRCGQDTDSNVGNCGGIMGTIIGYANLPQEVKDELDPYMDRDYNFTNLSINSATEVSLSLALENIQRHGGSVDGDTVSIQPQAFESEGDCEVSFHDFEFADTYRATDPALKWVGNWDIETVRQQGTGSEPLVRSTNAGDYLEIEFSGTCVYVQGDMNSRYGIIDTYIDGKLMQSRDMYIPSQWNDACQSTAVWITGLEDGQHQLRVKVSGKRRPDSDGIEIALGRVVSYRGAVAALSS